MYLNVGQLVGCEGVWVAALGVGEEKPVSVFECLKLKWIIRMR